MKNWVLIVMLLLLQAGIALPQGAFAQEPVGEVPIVTSCSRAIKRC